MKKYIIYTDGSCLLHGEKDRQPGGWAAVIVTKERRIKAIKDSKKGWKRVPVKGSDGIKEKVKTIKGSCNHTDSLKMEMTAALMGLKRVPVGAKVTVLSDSKILINGMNNHVHYWKKSGWINKDKNQTKNKELWQELDEVAGKRNVRWVWVKSHAGLKLNEKADGLARAEARRNQNNLNKLTKNTKGENAMELKISLVNENAVIPEYATAGAACFDLVAIDDGTIMADGSHIFRTGLSVEIPTGYGMFLFSRSGHGFKHDTRLANCVGVIDSDYRGEVMVKLTNDGSNWLKISKGDRICQGVVLPIEKVQFVVVDELSETVRGAGGFGSTGVN